MVEKHIGGRQVIDRKPGSRNFSLKKYRCLNEKYQNKG